MNVQIEPSWKAHLQNEFDQPYFSQLAAYVRTEYHQGVCYPPGKLIFNAFNLCPFENVRVIILGQDPYHEPGQAEGLSFSVPEGIAPPPSLLNIYREIREDMGISTPQSGSLRRWAEQGVLLLNATLTVRAHCAGSHQGHGWEQFTDNVVQLLSHERDHLVFLLWGSHAQRKGACIDTTRHLVLKSVHPSPLSAHRGFFGNHHFSQCNAYLAAHGITPINW